MSQPLKKNRRLCETLKLLNAQKSGPDVYAKDRNVKVKSKSKKCATGTFSMINFYQSIPNYDDIRHLPEYDFSERVDLLKKIHCDLSGTLLRGNCKRPISSMSRGSKRKTSGKKKKNVTGKSTMSPSLCNSFSKASLAELDESGRNKRGSVDRIPSATSLVASTPTPFKRLQTFRDRLLTYTDDWRYDSKCPSESKYQTPKIPSPKFPSPMCSPIHHTHHTHKHHYHHIHPVHCHDFDYPFDLFQSNFSSIHEEKPLSQSTNDVQSPPKQQQQQLQQQQHTPTEQKVNIKSSICGEKWIKPKKKLRRAKSCPKDLFSLSSSKCSENEKNQNESAENSGLRRVYRSDLSPCYFVEIDPASIPRQQNPYKTIPKIKVHRPKSKTPNSMEEFLSSKLVRSNHAAKLRQKYSRKKIDELAEEKLKASMQVSQFIPKCHHWNVRDTPGWKTFLSEDTTTEKRLREEARHEEQRVRKHTHAMTMNIMRARVKSAQLLLEGRSLSAKY